MEGSEAPEPVAVCDVAGPHSRIVDTTATAEGVTKLDDNLMTISSAGGHTASLRTYVMYVIAHSRNSRAWLPGVEKISADDRHRHFADAVLPLWCDRHVGNLRRRASSRASPATATANVAHRPYAACNCHRRRERGPRHTHRGTMETVSKAALCALVLAATIKVMVDLRAWRKRKTLRGSEAPERTASTRVAR
jgi:hypothetical protein